MQLIAQVAEYVPNEADLQTSSLETYLNDLKTKNNDVLLTYTPYSKAQLERDQSLYNPESGLIFFAKTVKKYVKSIYGATSLQYQQVMSIEFKKQK